MYAVLDNFHFRVEGLADKSLGALHSFLFPDLRVASLINTPDSYSVLQQHLFQQRDDRLLHPVNSKRKRLYHQHIRKFIHHKARQKIRLPEDYTAA